MELVVVESDLKCRQLQRLLGNDFIVKSTKGNVLGVSGSELGLNSETNYKLSYQIPLNKKNVIADLKALAEQSDTVFIATQPDREGEYIARNIVKALGVENKYKRLELTELTEQAIEKAFEIAREINSYEVLAQEAQKSIDRLVGFKGSAYLQSKLDQRNVSAGRVQSLALRLLVDLEEELKDNKVSLEEIYVRERGRLHICKLKEAVLVKIMQKSPHYTAAVKDFVEEIIELPPLRGMTTSDLLKVAYSQYGIMPDYTLDLAKALYDNGYITYYQTAEKYFNFGTNKKIASYLEGEGLGEIIDTSFYSRKGVNVSYKEPIRPTDFSCDLIESIEGYRTYDLNLVYQIIREFSLASVMKPARVEVRRSVISCPGYLESENDMVCVDSRVVDKQWLMFANPIDNSGNYYLIPEEFLILERDTTQIEFKLQFSEKYRYTPNELIAHMENLGIGKPYTLAGLVERLLERGYISLSDGYCIPTELGVKVIKLLRGFSFIESSYTSYIEHEIDKISLGGKSYKEVVASFDGELIKDLTSHS